MRRLAAGLLMVALAGCACSFGGGGGSGGSGGRGEPRALSGTIGSASFQVEVPARWNGTLFLYSHGYVAPGQANPATDAPGPDAANWLLQHGYAIAGSSYSSTGWAVAEAVPDQLTLLDRFTRLVGTPKRTIAWGVSLGGLVTAALVEQHPERFAGAVSLCGALAGGVSLWNLALDGAYAFRTLLAPTSQLQLVHVTDPVGNNQLAGQLLGAAAATPAGRARLALVAALVDVPAWFDPTSPPPAAADLAGQVAAQVAWIGQVDLAWQFGLRAELERRAGGNPSSNTGVDYKAQFERSDDRDEVTAVYHAAGMNLDADLSLLNAGPRVTADPAAAAYLRQGSGLGGALSVPLLGVHTTGDGLVVPESEAAYAAVVAAAGHADQLRQVYVHRAGHCAFTAAEGIAAAQALLQRVDSGRWNEAALAPAPMNSAASALGSRYNAFGSSFSPTAPAFTAYQPGPFLR